MKQRQPNQPVTEEEKTARPYKIQRPLVSSGPFEYLIYSRKKDTSYFLPGPDASMDQLLAGRPKIYVLAHFDENLKLVIHHQMPELDF